MAAPVARLPDSRSPTRLALGGALLALAIWCATEFFSASWAYLHYWLPAAAGLRLPPHEMAFFGVYLAYGLAFCAALAAALELLGAARLVASLLDRLAARRATPLVLVAVVVASALLVRWWPIARLPVADDEEVYLFIARTLLAGGVTTPPGIDPEFLGNQFVVAGAKGLFGKYPPGHGLVLAAGLATHAVDFVLPLVAGLTAWLTFRTARALVGPRRAVLALVLLALSPHFVWTHATLLSQPSAALALAAAIFAVVKWRHGGRPAWLLGAGAALGFELVTRPMPGVLHAVVVAAAVVAPFAGRPARAMRALVLLGLPVAAAAAALLSVQLVQTGSLWITGYQAADGRLGWFAGPPGASGVSLFAALLRENFWLLGWPLSLLPVAAARPARGRILLWGPFAAALVYRLAVPKTGVATTGPVYLLEAVPTLAILAADGLARLALVAARLAGRAGRRRVVAAALAATAASFVFFVPVAGRAVWRSATARGQVYALLEERGIERALVFANLMAHPRAGMTWAIFPPNPSPALDDDIVFLRLPRGPGGRARAIALWRERFADRPAFVFDVRPRARLRRLAPPGPR